MIFEYYLDAWLYQIKHNVTGEIVKRGFKTWEIVHLFPFHKEHTDKV